MQEPDKIVKPNPSKSKPLPSLEFLKECFEYVEDTGVLFWKKRPLHHFKNAHGMNIFNSNWVGKEAGHTLECTDGGFRHTVHIHGFKKILRARIIFVMSGNPDPGDFQIDHIDQNSLNDHHGNLRLATNQGNNANVGRKVYMGKVRHLPKGVYPNGPGKWQAKIKVNYKTHCLGTYRSPEEASNAYGAAANRFFGEFACRD